MTENGAGKGTAFFVRHGESTSNDRNVFAGAFGVPASRARRVPINAPLASRGRHAMRARHPRRVLDGVWQAAGPPRRTGARAPARWPQWRAPPHGGCNSLRTTPALARCCRGADARRRHAGHQAPRHQVRRHLREPHASRAADVPAGDGGVRPGLHAAAPDRPPAGREKLRHLRGPQHQRAAHGAARSAPKPHNRSNTCIGSPRGSHRQVYGFKTFERLTASGHEEPPAAEPLSEVFARVSNFYDEVVKPLTDAGKNVLVVSHQYALEPLALYLGGKVRPPRLAVVQQSGGPDLPASAWFLAVPRRLRGCHGPAERQGAVVGGPEEVPQAPPRRLR